MKSHYTVVGKLDGARPQQATVTIDRRCGLFSVRPYRRRRCFTLPLATMAGMCVSRVVKAEVLEARRVKAEQRKARRAGRKAVRR